MNAEQVFLAAVERRDPRERRAYLDEVLAADPELRDEVESLLRSHESAGSFLSRPAIDLPEVPRELLSGDVPDAGQMIGPYRVERLLGEGGMGIVLVASQEQPVRRRVALKLIRPGLSHQRVLDRFEAERQALALMDHPHIARILDAGVYAKRCQEPFLETVPDTFSQPYFVMELIEGLPITAYADQHRLTAQQRLELMIPVCEAVQHAHQKGIIHRDLKPSNVLVAEVDGRPVPKIIDFGVAKAIGHRLADLSIHTGFGQVVGTLEYMSPEQAGPNAQDIDTRTDIYALGVLLYELLTGSTPVNRKQLGEAAFAEVIRVIREVEPQKPSTRISSIDEAPSVAACRNTEPGRLSSFVRGDLDWIAMKALDKDRARRYQSAHELAEDLQRFLRSEPVLAGPPSATYRLRKFLRRNRVPAALAGLALLALVGGTVGTTIGMLRARDESRQKSAALEQVRTENAEKTRALAAEQAARTEADASTERAVLALQTLTDEAIDRLMASEPELSAANRDFLNQIVDQLGQFTQATDNSVKARVVQADGLNQIGNLKAQLGDYAGAIAAFRQSIAIWEPLCEERKDKPDYRRGMGDAWSNLGINLARDQQFEPSEQAHRKAIAIHDALAAELPDNRNYRKNSANVRNSFGVMLKDVQRNAETVEQYAEAIKIYEQVLADLPDDFPTLNDLSNVQNNYAIELFLAGKVDESIAAFEELIKVRQRLAGLPDADPGSRYLLAMTMFNLAMVLEEKGRADEAIPWLEKGDPVVAAVVADFPAVVEYRDGHANLLNLLATLYSAKKQNDAGIAVCERAVQLLGQLVREFPERADVAARQAQVYSLLAIARERNEDSAGCRDAFLAGLVAAKTATERQPDDADYQFQLANLHVFAATRLEKAGESAAAAEHWASARPVLESLLAKDPANQRAQKLLDTIPTEGDG